MVFRFHKVLEIQGKYLNFQEIQLIQVGEMTGKLAEVCTKIAERRNAIINAST